VEPSHDYLFFWDQMEKANLCLQGIIDTAQEPMNHERVRFFFKNPIGDGGTFCGVADLTEKYGLVPKNIMPETFSSDNTAKMKSLISSKLREDGLLLRKMVEEGIKDRQLEKEKTRMLAEIYGMLTLTLGTPPTEFEYSLTGDKDYKRTFTPLSFCQEILDKPLNGSFIMVMNDPRHDYYKTYEVEYDRHTYDGHNWVYLNLPMDDIESLAIASIKGNHKLYSSYDVGKFLDRSRGYCDTENYDYGSLFCTTFGMDKAQRISTFDSGSTHAMTLTAVELDSDGHALKWQVENSWGASYGYQGYLIMTDRWFREYMFRLVVDKKFVPEDMLRMCEQKPVMLMPEDPLFLPDE
jgi:bleomycin hydrolase